METTAEERSFSKKVTAVSLGTLAVQLLMWAMVSLGGSATTAVGCALVELLALVVCVHRAKDDTGTPVTVCSGLMALAAFAAVLFATQLGPVALCVLCAVAAIAAAVVWPRTAKAA